MATKPNETQIFETSQGNIEISVYDFNKVLAQYDKTSFFEEFLFTCKNFDDVESCIFILDDFFQTPEEHLMYHADLEKFWKKYSTTKEFEEWFTDLYDDIGLKGMRIKANELLYKGYYFEKIIWFYLSDISGRILNDLVNEYGV